MYYSYNISTSSIVSSEPALLLALSTLLLHPLTPRRLARQLLNFAISVALRVALLARGFHRVDTGGLVGFRGGVPGFGAGDCADCGLLRWWLVYEGIGKWMGERKGRTRRTSAAPLTYWAWPPMREGCCCCWSEEDILCGLDSGEGLEIWMYWF